MTLRARVIGLGQSAAGDDGVGPAILDRLRDLGIPDGIDLVRAPEASALISLLATPARVVLVDAVLAAPPGEVLEIEPEELDGVDLLPVSSHGVGVGAAIGLARLLMPEAISPHLRIVAVSIPRPDRYQHGLSPAVAAAVPRAAERVLDLIARDVR